MKSLLKLLPIIFLSLLSSCQAQENKEALSLHKSARSQVGKTTSYDPSYQSMSYPMGDVPIDKGVCTDVVIRAFRQAYQIDLQKEVHEDMKKNFSKYPKIWGLKRTDKNIDHRRVPNLETYFKRIGWQQPVTKNPADYLPGDLVLCKVSGKLPHIMIVSDKKSNGIPLIIHNIGAGTKEENRLFDFPIYAHFRKK